LFLGLVIMKFNKPALSFDGQIARLKERGLLVPDEAQARHYLGHLNYYRLCAYWLPFESDHSDHSFAKGASFDDVLNLYVFDRELRLLVLDAIERIEVSVRTQWAYQFSRSYGPHAHLDRTRFKTSKKNCCYKEMFDRLSQDVKSSKEVFIRHFRDKYEEDLPPLWAAVEVMSLGQLSRWFSCLAYRKDRNRVARQYGLDESILVSFLHHLSIVRNICAHHSRLWNRRITVSLKLPREAPSPLVDSLSRPGGKRDGRIYNTLVMVVWMLDVISPGHHFRQRLVSLLDDHKIDTSVMGFPGDWRFRPMWQCGPFSKS